MTSYTTVSLKSKQPTKTKCVGKESIENYVEENRILGNTVSQLNQIVKEREDIIQKLEIELNVQRLKYEQLKNSFCKNIC